MCGLVAYYTSTGERYARDKAFDLARSRSGSIDSCPPLKDERRGGEALRQVETLGNSSSSQTLQEPCDGIREDLDLSGTTFELGLCCYIVDISDMILLFSPPRVQKS
jgi:hypothetical protein